MEEINSSHIALGTDINQLSDRAIATIIESLQEEQCRRAKIRDYEIIRKFKEAAQQVFDANIPVYVFGHDDEEIYLDSVNNFIFEDFD